MADATPTATPLPLQADARAASPTPPALDRERTGQVVLVVEVLHGFASCLIGPALAALSLHNGRPQAMNTPGPRDAA